MLEYIWVDTSIFCGGAASGAEEEEDIGGPTPRDPMFERGADVWKVRLCLLESSAYLLKNNRYVQ